MTDESHLDQKYFIDKYVYNCPFCNRNNVEYRTRGNVSFDWSKERKCYVYFVRCASCEHVSMHLSYSNMTGRYDDGRFSEEIKDIDSMLFYSIPTSFFNIDSRIPKVIRELITEAEGCVKMNYLTGASACTRKAIYELTVKEEAEGEDYESRIKYLKGKYPSVAPSLFDVLCHIKDMTSDKIHEQSWDKWDSKHLMLFLETLKAILHDIYVLPNEKKKRSSNIQILWRKLKRKDKKEAKKLESKGQPFKMIEHSGDEIPKEVYNAS